MRWLRRFFYDNDPVVELVGGLLEPEAEMWRELLANNGVPAFTKIVDPVALFGVNSRYDMWVKRCDLERAREILAPLVKQRGD